MNYKTMKHPLTREQVEELKEIALELERDESKEASTYEQKDLALYHRQGAWRLINSVADERK